MMKFPPVSVRCTYTSELFALLILVDKSVPASPHDIVRFCTTSIEIRTTYYITGMDFEIPTIFVRLSTLCSLVLFACPIHMSSQSVQYRALVVFTSDGT